MRNMGRLEDALALALAEGRCRIGQISIGGDERGGFALRHRLDGSRTDLECFERAEDARVIGTNDDAGVYRPLKSALSLRRGWLLALPDAAAVCLALDYFYPAALGQWLAWRESRLRVTSLRQTVSRQTGMYRITGLITTKQADELIGANCSSSGGCLRTILWKIEEDGAAATSLPAEKFLTEFDQTGAAEKVIPIFCSEICNILVAAARPKVKSEMAPPKT